MSTMHELKTWPEYFEAVATGRKTFEVRKADRLFAVGDVLRLAEWLPVAQDFTGRVCFRRVTYVLRGGHFGIEDGFCVLGLVVEP